MPCSDNCFLVKTDPVQLQSLTSPKNIKETKKKEKQEQPLNNLQHLLLYSSSDDDDSSPIPSSDNESNEPVSKKKKKAIIEESDSNGGSIPNKRRSGKGKGKMNVKREKETKMEEVLPDGWTGQEVTLFRMAHPIFGHNYCAVAKIITTKTCHQVYKDILIIS